MCGIVGLYLKNAALRPRLGRLFRPMLLEMSARGPDAAGVAIYRDPVGDKELKLSLARDADGPEWEALVADLRDALGASTRLRALDSHAIVVTEADEEAVRARLLARHPGVRLVGSGRAIEIFKDVGLPESVYARFGLEGADGTHAIGHTRMATESAVVTAGSHPFATGSDLCLVHNGSLSNHNRLRERLRREGLAFATDNDTEVAAAYLTWRLRQGLSLAAALEAALVDLDGFFTFCVGTREGFAVLRDPIACKHAVLAECADWVAMATEYRAIAHLPGAESARIWEPEPGVVYAWGDEAESTLASGAARERATGGIDAPISPDAGDRAGATPGASR